MRKFIVSLFLIGVLISPGSGFAASKTDIGTMLPKELEIQNAQRYSANVKTMKYHAPGCKFYNCKTCTKFFKSPEAAKKAGYVPCGVCGG